MSRLMSLLLAAALLCSSAHASTVLTYQGRLEQSDAPVSAELPMRFQLFSAANGGVAIGPALTRSVLVDRGLFSVDLDFGSQAYQNGLWLQIEVDSELLQPRQRLAAAPLAVRSLDSAGLQASIDALLQRVAALESANTQLRSQVDTLIASSAVQGNSISSLQGALADANTEIDALQATVQAQSTTLASLNGRTNSLEAKTASITVSGDEVFFTGVNLHVRSGAGSTDAAPNGRGNLILGYNEPRVTPSPSVRTGSHNLVLGLRNSYTRFGGIVGGVDNLISGDHASVISGDGNQATGGQSVIVSGTGGLADDVTAVVIGGFQNRATGFRSVTVSGWQNDAQGSYSAILGGDTNVATATESSIGGGDNVTFTSSSKFRAEGTLDP